MPPSHRLDSAKLSYYYLLLHSYEFNGLLTNILFICSPNGMSRLHMWIKL
ncbi:hypothetical protein HanIR_Chr01g0021571 [Helianthus annuus]|nr:hypothetical protein HanIR_Chr01g0021571 [Helianthus annuus]